jgi:hypothetical protein
MNNSAQLIRTNGGFTADQSFNAPATGYMVSLKGTEVQFPNYSTMSDEQLERECQEYYTNEVNWERQGVYFGAWLDDGVLFFDNSVNIQDLEVAIAFGQANNQLAIWDIANGKSIRLD